MCGYWVVLMMIGLLAASEQPRRVWAEAATNLLGKPSPDGRYLSFVDTTTGDLAVRELATGRTRRLTANRAGSPEFAYFSAPSPDGSRIAYAWFNNEKFYDLRVVGLDGSPPKVLFRNEEAGFVQPTAWFPDGSQILTLLFRKDNTSQIALIPATAGPPRVVRSLNWAYPRKMDFSPDGRYLVYDESGRDDAPSSSLYVLSLEDSRETRLVGEPGNNVFPVWTRDGARVLFASDRSGAWGLWAVPVGDGRAMGAPVCLKPNLGRLLPMGITRQGTYFYGLRTGSSDVQVARLDLKAGRVTEEPAPLGRPFAGDTSAPAWSRDGRRLAMLTRVGAENFGLESRAVAIWSVESGQWQIVSPKLAWLERLDWSPDGRALLVSGSDRSARRGLFLMDVETGATKPVVREQASTYRGLEGLWSGDGRDIFYIREGALYRWRIEDDDERRIYGPSRLRELALSPDGRWLAFVSSSSGEKDTLLAVPTSGGEARQLASLQSDGIAALDWTADSRSILVTTPTRPAPGLWRVSLDGGKPERLAIRLERHGGLRLHPDGRRVAFTRGAVQAEVWAMDITSPPESPR